MLGLEAPDSGRVIVEDEDITIIPRKSCTACGKSSGCCSRAARSSIHERIRERRLPLREHAEMSEEEIARAVKEKLGLVNLPNTENLMPVDLSGGMRKRVGLARSIVLDPKMILYDEPTTGSIRSRRRKSTS